MCVCIVDSYTYYMYVHTLHKHTFCVIYSVLLLAIFMYLACLLTLIMWSRYIDLQSPPSPHILVVYKYISTCCTTPSHLQTSTTSSHIYQPSLTNCGDIHACHTYLHAVPLTLPLHYPTTMLNCAPSLFFLLL